MDMNNNESTYPLSTPHAVTLTFVFLYRLHEASLNPD